MKINLQPVIWLRKIVTGVARGSMTIADSVCLALILSATAVYAADWPSWGGQPSRNMASETEKGLPDWYALGVDHDYDNINLATTKNIKWAAKLGNKTCGSPIVSQGRVFIGTTGAPSTNATLLCLDEKTGRELGRFNCHRPQGRGENWGVCSTPTVEGDYLYFVTPYQEAVCVNLTSWLQSSDAVSGSNSDQYIVWRYDMFEKLHAIKTIRPVVHPCSMAILSMFAPATGVGKPRKRPTSTLFIH